MTKKRCFINYVSKKLIHRNTTKDGTRVFFNISMPYAESESGYASFAVNPGQLLTTTKKDGTVVKGMHNVILGKPEQVRKVSIVKDGAYTLVEMTNGQIAQIYNDDRREYRRTQRLASREA